MTAPMPTRITIEVHPPQSPGEAWTAHADADGAIVRVGEPREDVAGPAGYEPGECHCLDEAECGRDHANE